MSKYQGGRPVKINDNIINAFNEIVNDGMNSIILTDDELVFLVNEKLREEDKFSYTTFKNWKSKKDLTKEELDDATVIYNIDKYEQILSVIKKALITQKNNLFNEFKEDKQTWTKWAWIIERKFDDWNLRIKSEATNKNQNINKIELEIIEPNDSKNTDNQNS